jgi:DNA-binding NtrC family response regulator
MEASDTSGQQGRILLVDDDSALGGYLSRVLRTGGFDVAHELDAYTALLRVRTEQWDLLMTDIELPGMSGLELLDRVHETVPGLPVVVLTGNPSVDYAASALHGSAAEFLSKPVSPGDLLAKATELIEAGRAGAGLDLTGSPS